MIRLIAFAALVGCSTPPDGPSAEAANAANAKTGEHTSEDGKETKDGNESGDGEETQDLAAKDGKSAANGGQAAAAGDYTFVPAESLLAVKVFNDGGGLLSGVGHDHVLVASAFDGTFTWDPDEPGSCEVAIAFDVGSLKVDPEGIRSRVGLKADGGVDADKEQKILANAWGTGQLNKSSFPSIEYASTGCSAGEGETIDVAGALSIRGASKDLTVPMTITRMDDGGLHATGTFTASTNDFGFDPYKKLGGALKNKAQMEFVVDLVGR